MNWLALACVALVPQTREPVSLQVTAASLFKNGFAVVLREAPMQDGETVIAGLPMASLGALWITASQGATISEAVTFQRETIAESDVQSLTELLQQNVGKNVELSLTTGNGVEDISGKVLSVTNGTVLISNGGTITGIQPGIIRKVSGAELLWKAKRTSISPALRIRSNAPANAKLYVLALENGLTWVPAYAIDISDSKKLRITAKATIMNDLAKLSGFEIKLITGFPNLPFRNISDPFTLGISVNDFTRSLMQVGAPDNMPRSAGQMMMNQGGFDARARGVQDFDEAFRMPNLPGLQQEDLFFYRLPNAKLERGERGYYVLLSFESPYEHVYEWDVMDQEYSDPYNPRPEAQRTPEEVWHSLKFTNQAKQPLTTAPAIVTQNGQLLGQDLMKYVAVGEEGLTKITKALDVHADAIESEVSRERKSLDYSGYKAAFDEILIKGTLIVENFKKDTIRIVVKKQYNGTGISQSDSPKVDTIARGLRAFNPRNRLTWNIELKPGEKKELSYSYRLLIRV